MNKKGILKKNALILLKGIFNNVGGCKISRKKPGVLFHIFFNEIASSSTFDLETKL